MHNKLFVADGAIAVAGGRNLADEYFFRSKDANFIDFDMLMAGAIVPQPRRRQHRLGRPWPRWCGAAGAPAFGGISSGGF